MAVGVAVAVLMSCSPGDVDESSSAGTSVPAAAGEESSSASGHPGPLTSEELRAKLLRVPELDCGAPGSAELDERPLGPVSTEAFTCVAGSSTVKAELFAEEIRELSAYASDLTEGSPEREFLDGLGYTRGTTWIVSVSGPDGKVDEPLLQQVADAVSSWPTILECGDQE
jgi:hypothetical protein